MIEQKRRTGETTRILDNAVQELFNTGSVKLRDTHENSNAGRHILNTLLKRLKIEHNIEQKDLDIDLLGNIISLKYTLNNKFKQ